MGRSSFAFVIPAQRHDWRLDRAVESCLQQRLPPDRVVVVLADEQQGQSTHGFPGEVQVITALPSTNAAAARNLGIQACQDADFIAFLDADDVCHDARLLETARAIGEVPESDIVSAGGRLVSDQGEVLGTLWDEPVSSSAIRARLLLRAQHMHSTLCVRASLFESLGGYDESMTRASDYEYLLRAATADARMTHIPRVLVDHSIHAGQLSTTTPMERSDLKTLASRRRELATMLGTPSSVLAAAQLLSLSMAVANETRRTLNEVLPAGARDHVPSAIVSAAARRERPSGYLIRLIERGIERSAASRTDGSDHPRSPSPTPASLTYSADFERAPGS